jgi:hypothetical protein
MRKRTWEILTSCVNTRRPPRTSGDAGEGAVAPAMVTNGSLSVEPRLVEVDDPADLEDDDPRSSVV